MRNYTFFVTFKTDTATMSGPVTAWNEFQAIDAARNAWGVKCDGNWSAEVMEQRRAA